MSGDAERSRDRIADVQLDEKTIPRGHIDRDHERAAAVFDLIEDNRFSVRGRDDGPYSLRLSRNEARLTFEVRDAAGAPAVEFAVSMTPFQSLLKDYFRICETYFSAIRGAGARQIADIDRARTALHNEGAALLATRVPEQVEIDQTTARRLFTLVSALNWRP